MTTTRLKSTCTRQPQRTILSDPELVRVDSKTRKRGTDHADLVPLPDDYHVSSTTLTTSASLLTCASIAWFDAAQVSCWAELERDARLPDSRHASEARGFAACKSLCMYPMGLYLLCFFTIISLHETARTSYDFALLRFPERRLRDMVMVWLWYGRALGWVFAMSAM